MVNQLFHLSVLMLSADSIQLCCVAKPGIRNLGYTWV